MACAATGSKPNAIADAGLRGMNQPVIDIAETLTRLSALTIFELRIEWRRLHRAAPPMRLSRDLLIRGISYKLQERVYGGLSKAVVRKLEQINADPSRHDKTKKPASAVALKPGTRLVREWGGATHLALICAEGVEWRGRRYPSLSAVAREITGARWSGPRFFGLSKAGRRSVKRAEDRHAEA